MPARASSAAPPARPRRARTSGLTKSPATTTGPTPTNAARSLRATAIGRTRPSRAGPPSGSTTNRAATTAPAPASGLTQPRATTTAPGAGEWQHDEPRRDDRPRAAEWDDHGDRDLERAPRAAQAPTGRRPRRPAESWTAGDEGNVEIEGKRPIQSWLEPERGESRTIVLERSEPADIAEVIAEPQGRKTVTITGHPDRLPVPRSPRPPRTAVERIGASPDRIAGYAVLLGFVLILIAVLTTGQ